MQAWGVILLMVKQINQNNLCLEFTLVYQQSNCNWARLWNIQLLTEYVIPSKTQRDLHLTNYIFQFSKGNGKDFFSVAVPVKLQKQGEKRWASAVLAYLSVESISISISISTSITCLRNLLAFFWHQLRLFFHDGVAEREIECLNFKRVIPDKFAFKYKDILYIKFINGNNLLWAKHGPIIFPCLSYLSFTVTL